MFSCVSIGYKRNETNKTNEQKAKGISNRTQELMESCKKWEREYMLYIIKENMLVCVYDRIGRIDVRKK